MCCASWFGVRSKSEVRTNQFVHVIALDFSKAFDTLRHHTLVQKLASFPLPDQVINWLVDYLKNRGHCTNYNHASSNCVDKNSSIVQGSGTGDAIILPAQLGLHRVLELNALLVSFSNTLNFSQHFDRIAASAAQATYALMVLCTHDLQVRNFGMSPKQQLLQDGPMPRLPGRAMRM